MVWTLTLSAFLLAGLAIAIAILRSEPHLEKLANPLSIEMVVGDTVDVTKMILHGLKRGVMKRHLLPRLVAERARNNVVADDVFSEPLLTQSFPGATGNAACDVTVCQVQSQAISTLTLVLTLRNRTSQNASCW